ncbi:hypothetical protein TRVL_07901 [Trypanosoma vivax]|nr:hypothetical protein TRVL_07901 [Trypanosoma vivax]
MCCPLFQMCLFVCSGIFLHRYVSSAVDGIETDIALHRKAGYATCSTHIYTHAQRVVFSSFVYARSNLQYENVALMRGCRCLFGARGKMREGNRNVLLPSGGCSCPRQFAGAQHCGSGALRVSEVVGTPQAADKRRTTQGKMQNAIGLCNEFRAAVRAPNFFLKFLFIELLKKNAPASPSQFESFHCAFCKASV